MKKFIEWTCVSLFIFALFLLAMRTWANKQEAQSSSFGQTVWVQTKDWTMTVEGGTSPIDFGFRADGVMLWRKGVVNGGKP